MLFKSQDHLIKVKRLFKQIPPQYQTSFDKEKDVEVSKEKPTKFFTIVYPKPTFH